MNPSSVRWSRRAVLVLLLLVVPLLAAPDVSEADLERNARRLLRTKQNPEHYARLKRDYRAFEELPPERRAQLRQLDQDLRGLNPDEEARLLLVLERYGAFVESLSEVDRGRLEAVRGKERLDLIEQLRRQQWYDRLPVKLRAELANLPQEKRTRAVAKLVEEDRRRRRLLTADSRKRPFPVGRLEGKADLFSVKPTHLSQYPHEVVSFFEYHIRDRLTPQERARLYEAEGNVAALARVILDAAEKYPVLPASEKWGAMTYWKDLPPDWKKSLPLQKLDKRGLYRKDLLQQEGKWPDFALAVVQIATRESVKGLTPLGAARPSDYPPEIQPVFKRLPGVDQKALLALEGKWPEHPLKLHELARQAKLHIPGMTLPGSKAVWATLLREGQ